MKSSLNTKNFGLYEVEKHILGTFSTFFYNDIIALNLLSMFIKYRMKPEIIGSFPEHVLSVISICVIPIYGISVCGGIMSYVY